MIQLKKKIKHQKSTGKNIINTQVPIIHMLTFCHIHLQFFKGNACMCVYIHTKLESLPHSLETRSNPIPLFLSSEIGILKLVSIFTKQQ